MQRDPGFQSAALTAATNKPTDQKQAEALVVIAECLMDIRDMMRREMIFKQDQATSLKNIANRMR